MDDSSLPDLISRKMEQSLSSFPSHNESQQPLIPREPVYPGIHEEFRSGEAEWIISGVFGPAFTSEDFIPFRVLDSVLGGSMDSRLFTELRERRGLAYQVGSQYSAHLGCGVYALYAVSTPSNREEILRLLNVECERLQQEPVSDDELERAKQYLIGRHIMGMESNAGRAATLGTYELSGFGAEAVADYPRRLAEVAASHVREAAQRYLNNFVTMITTPKKLGALQ